MDDDDISEHYPATETEAVSTRAGSYFGKVLARHDDYVADGLVGNLIKDRMKDIEFISAKDGMLEVWRFPYMRLEKWDGIWWENRYVIGSDISEGLGETWSVAYVMDRKIEEVVARMRSRRTDAHKWAENLYWLSLFYDKAMIVPERTGAGITTVKRLMELNANLYIKTVPGKIGNQVTKEVGWSETHSSKHELCGDLKTWLGSVKIPAVYCNILLSECSTYIQDENGKLGPEEGAFGDCVIAAGCMIQGHQFIGRKPEAIKPEVTGWLKKLQDKGRSNWAT